MKITYSVQEIGKKDTTFQYFLKRQMNNIGELKFSISYSLGLSFSHAYKCCREMSRSGVGQTDRLSIPILLTSFQIGKFYLEANDWGKAWLIAWGFSCSPPIIVLRSTITFVKTKRNKTALSVFVFLCIMVFVIIIMSLCRKYHCQAYSMFN